MSEEIEKINEMINQINQSDIVRLKESIFINHFLPFFAGQEVEEPEDRLIQWYRVANGPTRPVDIVDEKGVVLYRVPPIANPKRISSKAVTNIEFAEVFRHFAKLNAVFPTKAAAVIDRELKSATEIITTKDTDSLKEDLDAWKEIFIRYGYIKEKSDNQITQRSAPIANLDFDPL